MICRANLNKFFLILIFYWFYVLRGMYIAKLFCETRPCYSQNNQQYNENNEQLYNATEK